MVKSPGSSRATVSLVMALRIEGLLPLVAHIQSDPSRHANGLRALAEEAGLSPSHLQRVFLRAVGESPKQIALRIALERAAAALITSQDSVLDIALDSGFDSHEGFLRAFRRHLGTTPSKYRQAGLRGDASIAAAVTHRQVAHRVAPCVGLHGIRLDTPPPPLRRPNMSYTITRKELTETPILFSRKRIRHDEIAAAISELLPAVYRFIVQNGIPMAGQPLCRYRDWGPGGGILEAGMPVGSPAEGEGDVLAGMLPAGPAASTVHRGPYEGLPGAHAAIEDWLEENGLRANGDAWEVYVTDPGEVPNPEEWRTEVLRPIGE